MKFLASLFQSGGCDYTIGCGHKTELFEAINKEDAVQKAKELCAQYTGESRLSGMTIYEVLWSDNIDVDAVYFELNENKKKEAALKKEESERQEYERLKAKYR